MIQITIGIGGLVALGSKETRFEKELLQSFGGYTKNPGFGGWKGPNGEVFQEPVLVYTVHGTGSVGGNYLAGRAARIFKQSCVLVWDGVAARTINGHGDTEWID